MQLSGLNVSAEDFARSKEARLDSLPASKKLLWKLLKQGGFAPNKGMETY